jgi:hypothetical protein
MKISINVAGTEVRSHLQQLKFEVPTDYKQVVRETLAKYLREHDVLGTVSIEQGFPSDDTVLVCIRLVTTDDMLEKMRFDINDHFIFA